MNKIVSVAAVLLLCSLAPGMAEALRDALERGALAEAQKAAHKLRGSVSYFGVAALTDLAVRLEYGDIDHEVILDVADAVRSVRGTPDPVDVIATYTPFQKLLKMAGLR